MNKKTFKPNALWDIVLWIIAVISCLYGCLLVPVWGGIVLLVMCVYGGFWGFPKRSDIQIPINFFSVVIISASFPVILYGFLGSTGWSVIAALIGIAVCYLFFYLDTNEKNAGFEWGCVIACSILVLECLVCWFVWMSIDNKARYLQIREAYFRQGYREDWRHQTCYVQTEKILDAYQQKVLKSSLFSEKEKEALQNPNGAGIIFDDVKALYAAKFDSAKQVKDSLFGDFAKRKRADFVSVQNKYQDRKDVLTIKRIWLNGDMVPWTYDAWTHIDLRGGSRSHYGFFGVSTPLRLDMKGSAAYDGDLKLDYIKIVLSDNSFVQFNIKDNPQWLLARVGEKVEVEYVSIHNGDVHLQLIDKAQTSDFSLLYKKEYHPLFK